MQAAHGDNWLTLGWVKQLALWCLCAAYLQGAYDKLSDFPAAMVEMQHFGLTPPGPLAAVTVVVELLGAASVLTGVYRYVGAIVLAAFTIAASVVANHFWDVHTADHFMLKNAFFEHLGLGGGLVLVAWLDLRERQEAR